MIDFPSLQNIASVRQAGVGRPFPVGKKDSAQPEGTAAASTDVVQISADAAMKGKLSAFAAVLAKEIHTADAGRIAQLKAQYAGDNCPVGGADVAAAILARIAVQG